MEKFQKWHSEHELTIRKKQDAHAAERKARRGGKPQARKSAPAAEAQVSAEKEGEASGSAAQEAQS